MRVAWSEIRLFVAELLLGWAVSVAPRDRDASVEIAEMVGAYMRRRLFLRDES